MLSPPTRWCGTHTLGISIRNVPELWFRVFAVVPPTLGPPLYTHRSRMIPPSFALGRISVCFAWWKNRLRAPPPLGRDTGGLGLRRNRLAGIRRNNRNNDGREKKRRRGRPVDVVTRVSRRTEEADDGRSLSNDDRFRDRRHVPALRVREQFLRSATLYLESPFSYDDQTVTSLKSRHVRRTRTIGFN